MIDHMLTDAEIYQLEAELREEERRRHSPNKPKWRVLPTAIGGACLVTGITGFLLRVMGAI